MSEKELNIEMTGESLDISEQRKQELKQLFPAVFTETTNKDGEVIETIDFEKLKAELGSFSDVYNGKRERYGMEWPGKRDCMKLIQQPSRATLKPCREESVDFDNTENLFIEGDNLEVLKLLQKSYYGKVKMIYIDPPYNTGKEFIYPDKYSENLETYLAYAGLVDDEGKKFATNTATEGRFHTKWLNMMYPRLYLARNLLKEDGVIFISIDDNEVENLRRMCDEIFGEENLLGQFIWKRRHNADNRNQNNVSADHEYVIAYQRSNQLKLKGVSIDVTKYKNPDNDSRGDWASIDLSGLANKEQRPNLHYDIVDPSSNISYPPNPNRGWSKSRSVVEKMIEEGRVLFPARPEGRPREKKFINDLKSNVTGFSTVLKNEIVGYTTNGTREVRELLGENIFDFPKPVSLLKLLIQQGTDEDGIVLDFFAGSASTAHSVLEYNFSAGARSKFIMVQLPEPIDTKTVTELKNLSTIADIGKERIRRAAKKIREQNETQLDLQGKADSDLGFKVLKLDKSNFKQWQAPSAEINAEQLGEQLELHTDHIDPYATQEEILYELLLKAGFVPTSKIDTHDLAGKSVFSIDEGALLICLEDELTAELIDAVAELEPMQFICLDKGFNGNDQLKANAVQTFKSRAQNAEAEMVFKVV